MSCIKILKSGARIEALTDEEQDALNREYNRTRVNYVRVQPHGFIIMDTYIDLADRYIDFKFNKDDVLLMGFPKSGTTWTHEILWTMIHNQNLDNPEASLPLHKRIIYFEHDTIMRMPSMPPLRPGNLQYDTFVESFPDKNPDDGIMLQTIEQMKSPRILKTHLSFPLLPQNLLNTCKVVFIARNPKDVVVSHHHYSKLLKMKSFIGSLGQFMDYFMNNLGPYCPYWPPVKAAWKERDHPNLHFMFYEDLKEKPKQEYTRLQNFLGLNLTEEQIDAIIQYTSFEALKERESLNFKNISGGFFKEVEEKEGGFFRKGIIGDSRNVMTEEELTKMSEWIRMNTQDMSIDFKYRNSL